MTRCSADYCTNSSTKGYQMFPRDGKRRKIWIKNVNCIFGPNATLLHCDVSGCVVIIIF